MGCYLHQIKALGTLYLWGYMSDRPNHLPLQSKKKKKKKLCQNELVHRSELVFILIFILILILTDKWEVQTHWNRRHWHNCLCFALSSPPGRKQTKANCRNRRAVLEKWIEQANCRGNENSHSYSNEWLWKLKWNWKGAGGALWLGFGDWLVYHLSGYQRRVNRTPSVCPRITQVPPLVKGCLVIGLCPPCDYISRPNRKAIGRKSRQGNAAGSSPSPDRHCGTGQKQQVSLALIVKLKCVINEQVKNWMNIQINSMVNWQLKS